MIHNPQGPPASDKWTQKLNTPGSLVATILLQLNQGLKQQCIWRDFGKMAFSSYIPMSSSHMKVLLIQATVAWSRAAKNICSPWDNQS